MRSDSVQAHNLLLSADSSIGTNKSDSHSNLLSDNHHRHYCHLETDGIIRCPHHVPLPDSEWHPPTENNFHNRNSYQVRINFVNVDDAAVTVCYRRHFLSLFIACLLNLHESIAENNCCYLTTNFVTSNFDYIRRHWRDTRSALEIRQRLDRLSVLIILKFITEICDRITVTTNSASSSFFFF